MATIRGCTGPVLDEMIRAASRSLSTNVRSAGAPASPRLKRSKVASSRRAPRPRAPARASASNGSAACTNTSPTSSSREPNQR